jgi:VanZ family protein
MTAFVALHSLAWLALAVLLFGLSREEGAPKLRRGALLCLVPLAWGVWVLI